MSYCRWSSMNWGCDVYVYESVSGYWTTHVAGRRRVFPPIPDLPILLFRFGGRWDVATKETVYPSRWHKMGSRAWLWVWAKWHRMHVAMLRRIPLKDIGLPHDGETFNDTGPGECADTLEYLRREGYTVPQYAIDALREEATNPAGKEGEG